LSDAFTNSKGLFIAGGSLFILIVTGLGVYLWKHKNR
jgi:hypothetical protein